MTDEYRGLDDETMVRLSEALKHRQRCKDLHDYIDLVREYVNGDDPVFVPDSHKALGIGTNHEGGHRLNVRIKQGAAWLGSARVLFGVTPGSVEYAEQAEQMERFARFGEQRLSRGTALHRWKQETLVDLFECGVSVVQHHPRRDFYLKARNDRTLMTRGARINDVFWRRRVDPRWWDWDEDSEGDIGVSQIRVFRELTELSKVVNVKRSAAEYAELSKNFPWIESVADGRNYTATGTAEVAEIWTPDQGMLIIQGEGKSKMAADNPLRIIARWRNSGPRIPFYVAPATPWPWHSPLDEMIALTGERNFWATMLDLQGAGAIFRHWQLVDTTTGDDMSALLAANPVPEQVLLDLSQPPPNMGPNTKWEIAPFEFADVLPRYTQIVAAHEAAGASVARLMGQQVNAYTAVGTADMMEDFARREFADIISAVEDQHSRIWEDTFDHIRRVHTKEPVVVAGRMRNEQTARFFQTHLEITGQDVVAEDITATVDTRSRISLIADYRLGREMRTNGDMGFDRAVEQGLVPWVDDAKAEKASIYIDQLENITLEAEAMAFAQEVQENLQGAPPAPAQPPAPPNITRGARTDPRGTGTERGPGNISDTALAAGATDMNRSA